MKQVIGYMEVLILNEKQLDFLFLNHAKGLIDPTDNCLMIAFSCVVLFKSIQTLANFSAEHE